MVGGKTQPVIHAKLFSAKEVGGDSRLFIGTIDDGYLNGAKLNEVLARGSSAKTWAFPLSSFDGDVVELAHFWEDYLKHGRCAIDVEHSTYFVSSDDRYEHSHDGDERICNWCGLVQSRKIRQTIKVVEHETWHSKEALANAKNGDPRNGLHESRVESITMSHTIELPFEGDLLERALTRIQAIVGQDPFLSNVIQHVEIKQEGAIAFRYTAAPTLINQEAIIKPLLELIVARFNDIEAASWHRQNKP